jgi:hypothetical protein
MIEYAELKTVRPPPLPFSSAHLTILILARDEADVSARLGRHQRKMSPFDRLCVVADHCSDSTARVARRFRADVFRRRRVSHKGGSALRWWLEQTQTGARRRRYRHPRRRQPPRRRTV